MEKLSKTEKKTRLETEILFRSAYLMRSGINMAILQRIYEKVTELSPTAVKTSCDAAELNKPEGENGPWEGSKKVRLATCWAEAVLKGEIPEHIYQFAAREFTHDGLMDLTMAVSLIEKMLETDEFYPDQPF